jgi:acetyl esterase/lipase
MKKSVVYLFVIFGYSLSLYAQQTIIPLYEGVAPGSENWTQKEIEIKNPQMGGTIIRNVVNPSLTVYLPEEDKSTGTAVIVAPGGGFRLLSWENEGTKVAEWLQSQGIVAFVLKYRLVNTGQTDEDFQKSMQQFMQEANNTATKHDLKELLKDTNVARTIELAKEDGRQAIKYVRANASKYKINPEHIGLMGFSAGGILTMGVALHHDAESRPNFIAPIYGISLDSLVVPVDAPPLFFACAADDGLVMEYSDNLYDAWKSANKSVEFHVYTKGGHGFGMNKQGLPVDTWIDRYKDWLHVQGF